MRYLAMFPLLAIPLWIGIIVGWVLNIVKIFGSVGGEVDTMFILRAVGIFFAPLGGVLGWMG